jgi:polyhydroxyalkanoate synthase
LTKVKRSARRRAIIGMIANIPTQRPRPLNMDRAPAAITAVLPDAALPAHSLERAASDWLGRISADRPELEARWASLDHTTRAALAQLTGGVSPVSIAAACADWAMHLALAPGKQVQLAEKALKKALRWGMFAYAAMRPGGCEPCIEALPQDKRFADAAWNTWPYNVWSQGFLLAQQWWHVATTGVPGTSGHHEDMVNFGARQWLDRFSPSNFVATNPVVRAEVARQGGTNLWQGGLNAFDDWQRAATGRKPVGAEAFEVGSSVAVTPGKVVFRNRLIELIQYTPTESTFARSRVDSPPSMSSRRRPGSSFASAPSIPALAGATGARGADGAGRRPAGTQPRVYPQPVLIVPAWIMKYYILDLSPHNSLIRWLVAQGHTVFAISWKNPDPASDPRDRDLGMTDYRELGVMAALDEVSAICAQARVHLVGYCLGGTLAATAAAQMARDHDDRLASLSLLAAQTDFEDPGEISLFIDDSQVTFLEDAMRDKGVLDAKKMAGAFQMLRSNDLIWSYRLNNYLLGKRQPMNDLTAWNADATRLPYRMHSEYLRQFFLENQLAHGRYQVQGRPVALTDIRVPVFGIGALTDHIAPWRSVYKIHILTDTDVTFALTSGGHNSGIVSEPGHAHRSYQVLHRRSGEPHLDPDAWLQAAPRREGSWWLAWQAWLAQHSSARVAPPPMGRAGRSALADAPGSYVHAG